MFARHIYLLHILLIKNFILFQKFEYKEDNDSLNSGTDLIKVSISDILSYFIWKIQDNHQRSIVAKRLGWIRFSYAASSSTSIHKHFFVFANNTTTTTPPSNGIE